MNRTTLLILLTCFIYTEAGTSMRKFLRRTSEIKESKRPIIHTFTCVDECISETSLDSKSITEWAELWMNAGWDPIVLTEKDIKNHSNYDQYIKQLTDAKVPPNLWYHYLSYLAMSTQEDGGWYADPSVIPIARSDAFYGGGLALPNEGKFTIYDGGFLNLISGNKHAWDMFSQQIMNNLVIKNDVVLFSLLMHNNPGMYFKENTIIHVDDTLSWKENVNCNMFATKVAAYISDSSLRERPKADYLSAINDTKEGCTTPRHLSSQPPIYTFFEMAFDGKATQEVIKRDLEAWNKAWAEAGWRPVILTLEDAQRHPMFNELQSVINSGADKDNKYEKMCFYRWLAVAISGGGWMADIDTYPLHMDPNVYGNNLPHEGKFTSHCWGAPCLVSGSEAEWNRVIPMLMDSLKKHNNIQWSDMFAMQEVMGQRQIIREIGHAHIHEVHNPDLMHDETKENGWKRACDESKDKLVMHFSHFSCEKAGFCHNDRGPVLNKWLDDWRAHCAVNSSEALMLQSLSKSDAFMPSNVSILTSVISCELVVIFLFVKYFRMMRITN